FCRYAPDLSLCPPGLGRARCARRGLAWDEVETEGLVMIIVARLLTSIGLLVFSLLAFEGAAGAQPSTDAVPISGFIEGVQKLMLAVGKIDGMIDTQITKEKRLALIRELTRLNRALADLEYNKTLLTDMVTDDEVDWDDLRRRMGKIRASAAEVREKLYAVGAQLSTVGGVDGFE